MQLKWEWLGDAWCKYVQVLSGEPCGGEHFATNPTTNSKLGSAKGHSIVPWHKTWGAVQKWIRSMGSCFEAL